MIYYSSLFFSLLLIVSCLFGFFGRNLIAFISSVIIPILVIINVIFMLIWVFYKYQNAIIPLFALILYGLLFNSFFQVNSRETHNSSEGFSILTYNTGGSKLKDAKKVDEVMEFISSKDPDIIVFQELWSFGWKRFKSYPYSFLGYRSNKSKSSQFIVSKFPILNKGYVDFPDSRNNAMYADIDYNGEVIRIYNIHLQSYQVILSHHNFGLSNILTLIQNIGLAQRKRYKQTVILKEHINGFKGKTILCGDFNSTPFSNTYKMLSKDRMDTFIEKGNGLGTTFCLGKYPIRLDYIMPDKNFEVLNHKNFKIDLSDHEPIITRIKLK